MDINTIPWDHSYDYNEELRKKFPNCMICNSKLVNGRPVIGVTRNGEIIGEICSEACLETYEKARFK